MLPAALRPPQLSVQPSPGEVPTSDRHTPIRHPAPPSAGANPTCIHSTHHQPVFARNCGVRCDEQHQKSSIPAPADTISIACGALPAIVFTLDYETHTAAWASAACFAYLVSTGARVPVLTPLTKPRISNILWGARIGRLFNECNALLRAMISRGDESKQARNVGLMAACH